MSVGSGEGPDAGLAAYGDADLYRRNAFRLSGLPVDATLRQVRRRAGEIEAAQRLGEPVPVRKEPFARSRRPATEEVLEALQRINDPRRRLVEEWFWLWPTGRKGGTETQLRQSWLDLAKSGSPLAPAALHNLAVTAHLNALEADHTGNSVYTAWKSAYRRWRQVLDDERCWAWLEARVEAAADPRLTSAAVAEIRRELPGLLLTTHAAVVASLIKRPTRLRAQLNAMRESGFDLALVDRALLGAVKSPVDRLRALVDRAKSPEFANEPCEQACTSVLDASSADLTMLRSVLGTDHPVVSGITDGLASGMRRSVIAEVNRTSAEASDWGIEYEWAVNWLDKAASVAGKGHVRQQIDADIATLLGNQIIAVCNAAAQKPKRDTYTLAAHVRLVKDTKRPLERLAKYDRAAHDKLCDEIAGTALLILVDYANGRIRSGADVSPALPGLREALALAKGPQLTAQIRKAVKDLERIARPAPPPAPRSPQYSGSNDALTARLSELGYRNDPFGDRYNDPFMTSWERELRRELRKQLTPEAACAWCGRPTEATRSITLSRYTVGGPEHRTAVVPACYRCLYPPLATGPFSRATTGMLIIVFLIWLTNVALTDMTITEPLWDGWWRLLAVIPFLPVLYATRRYLRQWLLRQNVAELAEWHRDGWKIVR
jgi:hypothetical protein